MFVTALNRNGRIKIFAMKSTVLKILKINLNLIKLFYFLLVLISVIKDGKEKCLFIA